MHKVKPDKTILVVSHGAFLNSLACIFTNNLHHSEKNFFLPDNNSLTILDLSDELGGREDKGYVEARLVAYNLRI